MKITLAAATEHAKVKLSVDTDAPLSQDEWDALSAQMRAWEDSVVSEGARTVKRLLTDLRTPQEEEPRIHPETGLEIRQCPRSNRHQSHMYGQEPKGGGTFEDFWCLGDE